MAPPPALLKHRVRPLATTADAILPPPQHITVANPAEKGLNLSRSSLPRQVAERKPHHPRLAETNRNIGRSNSSAHSGWAANCAALGRNSSTRAKLKPAAISRFKLVPSVR
jgi:hypothetical protein